MIAISRAWYNGSYTMAAKPIKSLEMHYTMIQFLIKWDIRRVFSPVKHIPQVLADCMKEEKVKGFMKVIAASSAAEGISFL